MTTSISETSVGKRKSSIARVRFVKGNGKILINDTEPINYFKRKSLVMVVGQPLKLVDFDAKYDILVALVLVLCPPSFCPPHPDAFHLVPLLGVKRYLLILSFGSTLVFGRLLLP